MLLTRYTTGPVTDAIRAVREPGSRRGFLRDLLALPLVGGSVTLVGAPTAVAEPVTRHLLRQYETWLGLEQARVAAELRGAGAGPGMDLHGRAFMWHRSDGAARPSERAALVLSAVGCGWVGA